MTKWLIDHVIHGHGIYKFSSYHIEKTMRPRYANRSFMKEIPLYSENHTKHTTISTMWQHFSMLKQVGIFVTTVMKKIHEVPLRDCSQVYNFSWKVFHFECHTDSAILFCHNEYFHNEYFATYLDVQATRKPYSSNAIM